MELPEDARTHSFLVRIWLEEDGSPPKWGGQVTHLSSNARRSFRRLPELVRFVELYLARWGIGAPPSADPGPARPDPSAET